jgi:predicted nucleotidyltransferase
MIDLTDHDIQEVRRIMHCHAPECEVRAFGSRVRGCSRPYSDLDLALIAPGGAIPEHQLEAIKDAFAESDLRIRVDVLDWQGISEGFRKVIEEGYEVVQEGVARA